MTLPQFAEATGFYSCQEVESEEFRGLLRQVVKERQDFCVLKEELERFWRMIAISPFSNNMVASDIRDPLYRFVHKILEATLIGRHEGDNKVNQHSLFCLMCMVERRPANLASILAWSLVRLKKGGGKSSSITYGAEELQLARIVTWDVPPAWEAVIEGQQVPPPPDSAAVEAMQAAIPQRYHVPLQRHQLPAREYPIRQPRPDPVTLEGLYDRVDRLFEFVEQVRQESRDGMRVIMDRLEVQLPPSWQPPQQEDPVGGKGGQDDD
ncbi:hypothetical protein HanIR_Chr17g0845661 [Helianthus annuus]|nr:hypothetical protein HanIR_Chr17g0845661 [Helianthus annuus]